MKAYAINIYKIYFWQRAVGHWHITWAV